MLIFVIISLTFEEYRKYIMKKEEKKRLAEPKEVLLIKDYSGFLAYKKILKEKKRLAEPKDDHAGLDWEDEEEFKRDQEEQAYLAAEY